MGTTAFYWQSHSPAPSPPLPLLEASTSPGLDPPSLSHRLKTGREEGNEHGPDPCPGCFIFVTVVMNHHTKLPRCGDCHLEQIAALRLRDSLKLWLQTYQAPHVVPQTSVHSMTSQVSSLQLPVTQCHRPHLCSSSSSSGGGGGAARWLLLELLSERTAKDHPHEVPSSACHSPSSADCLSKRRAWQLPGASQGGKEYTGPSLLLPLKRQKNGTREAKTIQNVRSSGQRLRRVPLPLTAQPPRYAAASVSLAGGPALASRQRGQRGPGRHQSPTIWARTRGFRYDFGKAACPHPVHTSSFLLLPEGHLPPPPSMALLFSLKTQKYFSCNLLSF